VSLLVADLRLSCADEEGILVSICTLLAGS
jgi:hypothetical protein